MPEITEPIKKLIGVSLLLCAIAGGSTFSHAELPTEVTADLLQDEIVQSLKNNDMAAAAALIKEYRGLGVEIPPAVLMIESKVAIARKDFLHAKTVLEEYFIKTGTKDKSYRKALSLYKQIQQPAADQASKQAAEKAKTAEERKLRAAHNKQLAGCNSGNAANCTEVGYNFDRGRGVRQDLIKASQYYELGCTKNNALGCSNLGILYSQGIGVAKDDAKAAAFFQKSCNLGDVKIGCAGVGDAKRWGRGTAIDYEAAKAAYRKSCKAGNEKACRAEKTVPKSDREQFALFRKTCETNSAKAAAPDCFALALQYLEGRGTDKDESAAGVYFKRACYLGHPQACFFEGSLLQRREMLSDAQTSWRRGCDLGAQEACDSLRKLNESMQSLIAPLQSGCDAGKGDDCRRLGDMFAKKGNGVVRDKNRGMKLYEQGCRAGDGHSCYLLATHYEYGKNDRYRALEWYVTACSRGYPAGCTSAERLR